MEEGPVGQEKERPPMSSRISWQETRESRLVGLETPEGDPTRIKAHGFNKGALPANCGRLAGATGEPTVRERVWAAGNGMPS